jgi:hypothetical protein
MRNPMWIIFMGWLAGTAFLTAGCGDGDTTNDADGGEDPAADPVGDDLMTELDELDGPTEPDAMDDGAEEVWGTITRVYVHDATVEVNQQVTLVVDVESTGTIDRTVTWSVEAGSLGSIDPATGVYTAPATTGRNTVWAVSNADPAMRDYGYVTVTDETACQALHYGYDPAMGADDDPAAAPYGGTARYVDPASGSNTGAGSIDDPWADLNYAVEQASAGDTIYLRGGIHGYGVTITSSAATTDHPIEIRSFPGEWAVFDGTGVLNGYSMIAVEDCSDLIFQNFEILNYADPEPLFANGVYAGGSTRLTFRNIYSHDCEGVGFELSSATDCLVEYCTAANNYDPKRDGDNADGFEANAGGNVFRYCVADYNSDDGFDFWDSNGNRAEYCVSHNNGRGTGGNGNGFKFGSAIEGSGGHTFVGCIALNNRSHGFDSNATPVGSTQMNCAAYGNLGGNWQVSDSPQTITNCLSAESLDSENLGDATITTSLGEVFGGTVTAEDFESVDFADLNNQTEGQRFFYPVSTALIDQGTDAGLPFAGTAPDIGAVEAGLYPDCP